MARKSANVLEFRVYDLPLVFPAMCLSGENWRISDVLSNRLHFHNCLELGLCHTDGGILVFENETVPFKAGDVTVIPRHIPHTTCSLRGTRSRWSYIFIDLERLVQSDGAKKASIDGYWVLDKMRHPRVHFLTTCILDELLNKRADSELMVTGLTTVLYQEIQRLDRASSEGGSVKSANTFKLKPALEHIAGNYMNPVTADELAEMCGLSTTHFRRLFTSVIGESPIGFLNTTRINKACEMLLTTDDTIISIAGAVGFATISAFNRYFSQVIGVSPKEYRNPSVRDKLYPRRKYIVQYKGWLSAELKPESHED